MLRVSHLPLCYDYPEYDYTATPIGGVGANDDAQYNGNITAVRWNRSGLTNARAYSYTYDPVNRMTAANSWVDDVSWGSSSNYAVGGIGYDRNGNLQTLTRHAADGTIMDQLSYDYQGASSFSSNQMLSVTEGAGGDATTGFVDGNTSGNDYSYDNSGNLTRDANKDISSISYNHLNLPEVITFDNGDELSYTYDASGTKLREEVSGSSTAETDYVLGREYRENVLGFWHHAEGRTWLTTGGFTQHYDIQDHLGNVRLTFAAEETQASMTASMETGGNSPALEEQYFENVAETRQTLAYHNATAPNTDEPNPNKVATLNAAIGRTQGPTLKQVVHRGDSVHIEVKASYEEHSRKKVQGGGLLTAVASLFSPSAAGLEAAGATESLSEALAGTTLLNRDRTGVPKAYLNYIVLNEEQEVVDQGFVPVSEAAKIETGRRKKGGRKTKGTSGIDNAPMDSVQHETLAVVLDIQQDGYLYTYVSNESNWDVDVHFDQMTIMTAGTQPVVVQSNDYYPHGLTHQQPLNNPTNDYLYNGMERVDDLDLNVYSAAFRTYDPVGRWWQQDPVQDAMPGLSAYHQTYGNPVNYRDPLGLYGWGGGVNRHIGETAGEQWMREHNMARAIPTRCFSNKPRRISLPLP